MTDATRVLASLPLDQLHDSPYQPRTHYAGLEGLADSIRTDGVLQPLMVRPRRPNRLRDDITDGYEIIFGHRRSRAAELAGLTHVPCVVVSMVDSEVRSAQMAENVQRDNMRAIEEAAGYQAQIEADGITMAELAKRIGMSPDQLALLLLDLVLCHHVHVNSRYAIDQSPPSALLAMAEHLGIDVEAARAEPASTPSSAARAAEDAPAVGKVPRGVKYMCKATGMTWTGNGLMPAWLRAALASGKRLDDFEVAPTGAKNQTDKARFAGQEVDDDAADGGERDPNTGDMFEESHA